jgi:acetyl-CoA acetyltransferase
VYGSSGLTPRDVDVLAPYDAYSVAVLDALENYGFCAKGESPDFVAEGHIELGGSIPVNPDGGHLSGGYLAGFLQHVELVRQLRGECGKRQVVGAEVGQYMSTGGFRNHNLSTIYTVGR